ncbi:MAG: hypothetical protein HQK76_02435 [Desulfobacterales bacterium]|nr:hypothetical protein [Desulfobacterales bacterium]
MVCIFVSICIFGLSFEILADEYIDSNQIEEIPQPIVVTTSTVVDYPNDMEAYPPADYEDVEPPMDIIPIEQQAPFYDEQNQVEPQRMEEPENPDN